MQEDQHSLKAETVLDQYRIIRILGEGGFGITYLAEDIQLGLKVVIKEYFPNEFAVRTTENTITAKSKSAGDFVKGMKRFKEEAQTLAKFNHPSIVKILGYFEANDTAYFVMEYEEGIDLSQYLKQENRALSQEEILGIIMPVLEGLKEVHKYNFLHRDIKPGNILLRSNKSPVLIDFGASKLALGEVSKSVTSMLTEGYAPLEQYSTDIKQQGAFTDVYAMAAVIYKMITSHVPPSAQTRSYALLSGGEDPYKSLSSLNLNGYDQNFLKAVDRALSISARERPQSVMEFQKDIIGELKVAQTVSTQSVIKDKKTESKNNNRFLLWLLLLILLAGGVLGYLFLHKKELPKRNVIEQKVETEENTKEKILKPVSVVWDDSKAKQIIFKKLRAYGNIGAYGFDHTAKQYPHVKLKHSIVGFYVFPFASGKHIVALTATAPAKHFEAHAFAPKLSFFEFKTVDGAWVISKAYVNTFEFGSWGQAPDKKEINVVKWGKERFGLMFNSSYSNQGYGEDMKNLYVLESKVKNVFSIISASNDGGTVAPNTDWKTVLQFDNNKDRFYDILLHKKGSEEGNQVDEKIVYRFDGEKYVKQVKEEDEKK